MLRSKSITADHKDIIHDLAYDWYGRRLATSSSDQYVKVWDLDAEKQWKCTSSWKAHSGSVWKVTWAHPEFGQVLATCSFDRTATVWEELGPEGTGGERTQSQWVKKTSLVDSRTPVTDVKFAPKYLGLQLATCSADGVVRIYEAPDIMNLSQWSLQHEISNKLSCSCISWSNCRIEPPMIAVGSDDPSPSSGTKISIFAYSENCRRFLHLEGSLNQTDPVYDIAFAPNLGRTYHYLAIATKSVQIILLRTTTDPSYSFSESVPKFELRQLALFDTHNSQVWRISWNCTGTILASSGDDGSVRLWKASFQDKWESIAFIKGDGTDDFPVEKSSGPTNISLLEKLGSFSTMHFSKLGAPPLRPLPWS